MFFFSYFSKVFQNQNICSIFFFGVNFKIGQIRQLFKINKVDFWAYAYLTQFSLVTLFHLRYNQLSQKNRFQSVPIAALCLSNIQRKTWFFKNLSIPQNMKWNMKTHFLRMATKLFWRFNLYYFSLNVSYKIGA